MVEDLMNVTLEYEYTNNSSSDEVWTPKGRLVAHVNEHSQAVNQLSLSDNNRHRYSYIQRIFSSFFCRKI